MELAHTFVSSSNWDHIFDDVFFVENLLNTILPSYVKECRWFGGKASTIKKLSIDRSIVLHAQDEKIYILILEVLFIENFVQHYFLPIGLSDHKLDDHSSIGNIHPLELKGEKAYLVDAIYLPAFRNYLFRNILESKSISTVTGNLKFRKSKSLKFQNEIINSEILKADQSNTSIIYNNQYFMKVYRRMFRDPNPDLEMVHFLSEEQNFKNTPRYAGSIVWAIDHSYNVSVALLQEKVENQGDAWNWLLEHVSHFFKKADENGATASLFAVPPLYKPIKSKNIDTSWTEYFSKEAIKGIKKIAKRTAQMHFKLFSNLESTKFSPVNYNPDYTVWLKNRFIYQFEARYNLVERNIHLLTGLAREYAQIFLNSKAKIISEILKFEESKLSSQRIRIHGDYHLGQILIKDNDFYIIDFEGEPESTIRDRKVKQSPLKDVAGLFRSFHYAIYATIFNHGDEWSIDREELFIIGEKLYRLLVSVFLKDYLRYAFKHRLDIGYTPEINFLLKYNLLEKAIYELGYELNGRPSWAIIPLTGIMKLLNESTTNYE